VLRGTGGAVSVLTAGASATASLTTDVYAGAAIMVAVTAAQVTASVVFAAAVAAGAFRLAHGGPVHSPDRLSGCPCRDCGQGDSPGPASNAADIRAFVVAMAPVIAVGVALFTEPLALLSVPAAVGGIAGALTRRPASLASPAGP
jgi:hypothetical protein